MKFFHFIFIGLFSTCIVSAQNIELFKENDHVFQYNLRIECRDFSSSSGYYLIINNSTVYNDWSSNNDSVFGNNSIYYIAFDYNYRTGQKIQKRIIKRSLSNFQLDSIFVFARNLFNLNNKVAVSDVILGKSNNFRPIDVYDGESASIDLDLCLLGEKYTIYISNADPLNSPNIEYIRLITYLLKIGNISSE